MDEYEATDSMDEYEATELMDEYEATKPMEDMIGAIFENLGLHEVQEYNEILDWMKYMRLTRMLDWKTSTMSLYLLIFVPQGNSQRMQQRSYHEVFLQELGLCGCCWIINIWRNQ